MHEDLFPRRSAASAHHHIPAGAVATLSRPLRSEREAREGRLARAELDRLALGQNLGALLLSKDTPTGWGGSDRPGRFAVAESQPSQTRGEEGGTPDRDRKDQRWVAFWQDAASGACFAALGHRSFACALEDIARRHRAGRIAFVSGFQRRAGS